MTRTIVLRFTDETDWATTLEAMRRLRKLVPDTEQTEAELVAGLCRTFLDGPPSIVAALPLRSLDQLA